MSEIRIRLDATHFRQLVAGKVVEISWDNALPRPGSSAADRLRSAVDAHPIKIILADIGWDVMAEAIYAAMDANIDEPPDIMGAGPAARMYTREASQRAADRISYAREVVEAAHRARAAIDNDPVRFYRDPDGPFAELWKALEAHDAVGAGDGAGNKK